jgi:amino acid transporter
MSSAKNILKVLVGIIIFIIGIVWYAGIPGTFPGFLTALVILLEGTIGLFLLFVGLIVAWMGYDDYKMDAEMAKEEQKEGKKEEPK